jgi:hypothetical protein
MQKIVSALSKGGSDYVYCKALDANKKLFRVPGSQDKISPKIEEKFKSLS